MQKEEIIARILREKLIVIVRGVDNRDLIPFAEAIYAGGIRLLEVTYNADGSIPHEVTAAGIRALKEHFGDRMSIGAGTVLTPETVDLTAEAGGEFIISPDTSEEVIRRTVARGLVSLPGAFTPTEAQFASRCGADFVKLFPASALGPSYVKALCAPLSHIRFLAVGGIGAGDIPAYLKAGAVGFGIGGKIVDKSLIASGDFAAITEQARLFVSAVR